MKNFFKYTKLKYTTTIYLLMSDITTPKRRVSFEHDDRGYVKPKPSQIVIFPVNSHVEDFFEKSTIIVRTSLK